MGALIIQKSFDGSWTGNANVTAYNNVLNQVISDIQTAFAPAVDTNVTIGFGYGVLNGQSMGGVGGGASQYFIAPIPYSTLRTKLQAIASNSSLMTDAYKTANLPSSTIYDGSETIYSTDALLSAINQSQINNGFTVGWVGVGTGTAWDTSDIHGASGGPSLYAVLAHEITEVLGRWGKIGNGIADQYGPGDLHSWSATGVRDHTNAAGRYAATDGATAIVHWSSSGDICDTTETNDAFNAFVQGGAPSRSSSLPLQAYDWQVMNLIGWPLSATGLTWAGLDPSFAVSGASAVAMIGASTNAASASLSGASSLAFIGRNSTPSGTHRLKLGHG